MDSLLSLNTASASSAAGFTPSPDALYSSQAVALSTLIGQDDASESTVQFDDLYKALSVSAQEIVNKLNELLKAKLPNGLASLKPEDVTPEVTAERIVTSVTASFENYRKGRGNEDPETVLNDYIAAVKRGVEQGYGDAYDTLNGLGAFEFEGIEEGIAKTKDLIGEKLAQFEAAKRKELGLDTDEAVEAKAASSVKTEILVTAGSSISRVNVTA